MQVKSTIGDLPALPARHGSACGSDVGSSVEGSPVEGKSKPRRRGGSSAMRPPTPYTVTPEQSRTNQFSEGSAPLPEGLGSSSNSFKTSIAYRKHAL
jgi:hypothetical protein